MLDNNEGNEVIITNAITGPQDIVTSRKTFWRKKNAQTGWISKRNIRDQMKLTTDLFNGMCSTGKLPTDWLQSLHCDSLNIQNRDMWIF